ncbi:MAG: SDR family NAD(P)-dependent oxidoreductase, partial [Exilibacterium sp.]
MSLPLSDVAYTLQVGREAMEARVVFWVVSVSELQEKLALFCEEKLCESNEFYQGYIKQSHVTAPITKTSKLEKASIKPVAVSVNSGLSPEDYKAIAKQWSEGASIDWSILHSGISDEQKPRIIGLPNYPFLKVCHWIKTQPLMEQDTSSKKHVEPVPPLNPLGTDLFKPLWEEISIEPLLQEVPSTESQTVVIGGSPEAYKDLRKYGCSVQSLDIRPDYNIDRIVECLSVHAKIDQVLWVATESTPSELAFKAGQDINLKNIDHLYLLFRIIKALLVLGYGRRALIWSLVTYNGQAVEATDTVDACLAGVHGLVGAMAKEFPSWKVRLLDLETSASYSIDTLFSLPFSEGGKPWIYRRGKWLVQKLAPLIPVESQRPVYRERGVYVVIGGAGGIGEVWSESIIRDYHAQVIWIGRRQRDTAITEKIKRLGEIGLAPLYIQADASDYKSLRDAYRQIKRRFPQVSGVIQSAVGVLDQSLNNMSEKLFRASLSSKVDVSVCVARIFGSEPLDFMLFFSSIVSFSRDHGKSGYAAGCAFEDAFAHQLSCSFPYSVKVMNWGWWGNTGIAAVVPDTFKQRMTRLGILPITRDNGMRALNTLLTANIKQMANVALTKKDAMADLTQEESVLLYQPGFASIHKKISASVKRKSIATSANLDIASHSRWIEQTISLLVKANYLDTSDAMRGANSTFAEDREAIWNEWNAKSKSWRRQPDLCARVVLAGATLRELVNILQRKKLATEVIFPNMSMALVEDIYKNNPISDYYNAIVADTVVEFVEQRRHQYEKPCIRILEVGAGTGGTSAVVFEKLKPYQDCIAEYCYSDISKAFTLHAQQTYGPYVPYLSYQIFDVEKPLQAQSVLNGRYDLVIATNVLHATKNIRRTLRNVKATLKNCGVLLLNELSDNTLFLHLTFGLLDGWWLSEDNDLRIPGSPLLSPQSWKAVLESEGFHTEFPAQSVHTLGHQIIIAESDGVVRQRQASPVENDSSKSSRQKIDIERQLPGADSAQQPNMLDGLLREKTTHYFRDLVANTLKFPSADLDDREPLGSYGIDSILVIQLTNDLGKVLENVDSSLFYTYQTIDALVNHFITTQKDTLIKLFGLQGVDDKASNAEIGEHLSTVKPRTIDYQELASKQIDSVDDKKVQNEPIAIIGMSGRFPQAENVDMLWENLKSGKDCIAEIPVNRWPHDGFFLPDKNTAIEEGKSYSKWGGFLDGHRLFDPLFFNISPREAVEIDPQERLFMQSCWETFEDAGYFRQRLMQQHNGRVGIFAGVTRTGFDLFGPELWRQGGSSIPHTSFSSIANRISYFMNFNGPSLPVDTMCSSSLTAVHQACVALQLDECEMAIAGGVNLYLHPSSYIWLCRQQMLSVSGHCSSFGEGGDGFVPGEGVGTLLLKPISRAQADGDPIYALIRGTGINHGGKTHGYSVPNAAAQGSLIRRVLDKAGVDASMVSYVEAHGTGTKLGDPIEVSGLNQAFRVDTSATQYCAMGSIKSNIGHLEAAAGVAGLIKVILQMKHKQIVPSLHSSSLNSNIDFENSPFVVQQETQFWHRPKIIVDGIERKCARIAGVSSFGAGGANAHVVVEEYRPPQAAKEQKFASAEQPVLIILSAKTEIALIARAARLLEAIEKKHLGTKDLLYIAYTLQIGREAMTERLGVVVNSIEDLIEKLSQVINDKPDLDGIYRGTVRQDKDMLQLLAEDEDLQQASISWARKGKYGKLLNFWVRGLNVNWHELYNAVDKPRCIRLPVYPFAGEEYWFPALTSQSPDDRDEVERICASSTISELVNNKNTTLLMRPEWRHQPVTETSGATVFAQHCAILCGVKAEVKESIQHLFNKSIEKIPKIYLHEIRSSSDIDERYQHLTDQVYKTLQDLLKAQLKSKVLIQVLITLPLDSAVTEQALFSGLSGLIKTACKESPNILGQVIEVLSNESANSIVKKITENSYSPYDVDIHYRKGSRWVLDWHRINFSVDYKKNQLCKPWRENGTYLISGGAGGLGIEITEEIVKSINNPKIILTGRTPENETIRFKIEQLKCSNAHVEYQKVDVADTNKVNQLIDDIKQRFGTLNGVIHSAGIVRDNYIYNKDLEEIEQVLAPKVKGVVNLDRATQGIRLDFFIMFSSIAASLGSVAQADYAAANAFLDRYAGYRNRLVDEKLRHGRTLSINWPLWKHGGMQVDVEAKRLMKDSIGIVPMETVDGINAFYQAWSTGLGQVMVLFGDSAIISESVFNSRLANSSEISEAATKLDSVNTSQILPSVVQRLKNIFSTTADIPISRIDGNEPLESYGIDSMMIHRLNRQLESIFGALSKTLFYEYQTLNALGEFLSRDKPMECIKWTGLTQEQINHREKAIKSDNVGNNIPITSSTRLPQSAATLVNDISQDKTAEPIAVIGLSGRYPKSETMALFWQNLQDGSDCITEIPPERWPLEDFFVPDKRQALKQAKSYSKWGGFLSGFAEFDPLFFNISPSEAQGMDPQERQFLECCWAVFEDAGYTKQRLQQQHNGQVGIFVGITKTGFGLHGPDLWRQGETLFPRISFGSVANRISYLLNLRGPSMPIDTMCSASLTAVHEACEHIYRAECELAVAGGVNLYLHPANYIELCAFQMLSVDGQCKSFSEGGNGFVPGEGVGAVLLKPLVLAKRDCDHIYATIRGTSINHGGKTNGYTDPNPVAQGELIRAALDKAGINARTVSYIEAHGTGTELGDPIEITGLQQAFEPDTQDKQFCAIGSIKTNIGHLEAAAGIAGLTKIILQLKHRKLVPSLHASKTNPNIDFKNTPFFLQKNLEEWKRPCIKLNGEEQEFPLRAGISSFGAGGANAHVLVEEHIDSTIIDNDAIERSAVPLLILLSAKSEDRLVCSVQNMIDHLEGCKDLPYCELRNLAFTLQVGREAMEARLAIIVQSCRELLDKLQNFLAGKTVISNLFHGRAQENDDIHTILSIVDETTDVIETLLKDGRYDHIANLWVKGANFEWRKLYKDNHPQCVSLPSYPFRKQRYWIDSKIINSHRNINLIDADKIHPLLHKNVSKFGRQQFVSTFSGRENFF